MSMNLIQLPASKFLISLFNPFNICQLYFSFLDYRFAPTVYNDKHFQMSGNNILMMMIVTGMLFVIFTYVLELKFKEIE